MTGTDERSTGGRNRTFDGIRGYAIALVVLSHGWILWPTDGLYSHTVTRVLFTSGNTAVSVFLAVGFFLLTRTALKRAEDPSQGGPEWILPRRVIRLGGQTYALLLVVVLVTILDTGESNRGQDTGRSLFHIATFTWNWYLHDHADVARPDLGHLWYISADMQMLVVVLLLVLLLRRRPVRLVVWLAAILLLMWWWRHHVYDVEAAGVALRTWARGDAAIAGALAAASLRYVRAVIPAPDLRAIAVVSTCALPFTIWLGADLDWYFGLGGILLDLNLIAFLVSTALAPRSTVVSVVFENRLAVALGSVSLGVYLWHYPVFWFVATHAEEMDWVPKASIAFGAMAVLAVLAHVYVERRVQQLLDLPWWSRPRRAGRTTAKPDAQARLTTRDTGAPASAPSQAAP